MDSPLNRSLHPLRDMLELMKSLRVETRWICAMAVVVSGISGLFEAFSVAVIMPFTALIVPGPVPPLGPWWRWLAPLLPAASESAHRMAAVLGLLLAVFVVKFVLGLAAGWMQACSLSEVQSNLGQVLLDRYLGQTHLHAAMHGTSRVQTTLGHDLNAAAGAFNALGMLVVELFAMGSILILLIVIQAEVILFIALGIGLPAFAVMRALRRRHLHSGVELRGQQNSLNRQVIEAVSAFKEIVVLGRLDYYRNRLIGLTRGTARAAGNQSLLAAISPPVMEFCAVSCLAATMAYLAVTTPPDLLFPSLAVFVAAAFRVTPGVIRAIHQWGRIVHSGISLSTLVADLENSATTIARTNDRRLNSSEVPAIHLENAGFIYPGREQWALRNIDLVIPANSFFGVAGASGAGKSTLVDLILGLLPPGEGRVVLSSAESDAGPVDRGSLFAYVPQTVFVSEDTVRRNVALGICDAEIDDARIRDALEAAQLLDFVESLPLGLDAQLGERGQSISAGQRQRIGIARALYHQAQILILDEATSALDRPTEQAFLSSVASLHRRQTVIVVTHRLGSLQACDRILVLERGGIVGCGTYAQLRSESAAFNALVDAPTTSP